MSKIIKAGYTRYLPSEQCPIPKINDNEPSQEEIEPDVSEMDLRAAYDELITTAQDEVALLLEDARKEAHIILSAAQDDAESIRQNALDEGFQNGLDEARRQTEDMINQAHQDADAIRANAEQLRQEIINDTEPQLLKLAFDVAEKILRYELDHNAQAFMSILTHAIDNIRDSGSVLLRMNALDADRCFENSDSVLLHAPSGNVAAAISRDPAVQPGDCIIETENGTIDTNITAQLSKVANSLGID